MSPTPTIRFLSLFVPDLEQATHHYEALFGVAPQSADTVAPSRHPFSPSKGVVFNLGGVELALYQTDGKTTHAGDVGIGVETSESSQAASTRASQAGARVFPGARPLDDRREMVVLMTPDRHFFELVSERSSR